MKRYLITSLFAFLMIIILAVLGISFTEWQFYVVMIPYLIALQIAYVLTFEA